MTDEHVGIHFIICACCTSAYTSACTLGGLLLFKKQNNCREQEQSEQGVMSEPCWLYVSAGLQVGSGPTPPGAPAACRGI